MDYIDLFPENKEYVDEIRCRNDFNNLHDNLPDVRANRLYFMDEKLEDYPVENRDMAAEILENLIKTYEKETLPYHKVIDKFLEENGFDQRRLKEEFGRDKSSWLKSQLMLCPLYIHLRKAGYSEQFIVR
jgi:hypothetical protein